MRRARDGRPVTQALALNLETVDEANRRVTGVFCSEEPNRNGEMVLLDGMALDSYLANPVLLWNHSWVLGPEAGPENIIGMVEEIGLQDGLLRGVVRYAVEENEKARQCWSLIAGGYLRGYSVGFIPHQVVTAFDDSKSLEALPGKAALALTSGQVFAVNVQSELLEISQVLTGADRRSVIQAVRDGAVTPYFARMAWERSGAGELVLPRSWSVPAVRTQRAESSWTVGGAGNLPLAPEDAAWDTQACDRRVKQWAGGDDLNWSLYRRAYVLVDAANPDLQGSYRLGFADVIDGELMAVPEGVRKCSESLMGTGGVPLPEGIPETVLARARGFLDAYLHALDLEAPWATQSMEVEMDEIRTLKAEVALLKKKMQAVEPQAPGTPVQEAGKATCAAAVSSVGAAVTVVERMASEFPDAAQALEAMRQALATAQVASDMSVTAEDDMVPLCIQMSHAASQAAYVAMSAAKTAWKMAQEASEPEEMPVEPAAEPMPPAEAPAEEPMPPATAQWFRSLADGLK